MKSETISKVPRSKLVLPVAGRDHIRGRIHAPVSLVEYGDYECPYCGEAYPIIKAVQKELGQNLCFAFRNFPLINSHPHAEHAAEAAEIAGAYGRFWEMHDVLFERQKALDDENLAEYAAAIGLDPERLIADVESGAQIERVKEDYQSGTRAGVHGTPSFFINGVFYEGDYEFVPLLNALTAVGTRPEH
ncbi:MAG: bdbD [Verrucomicrobiales bacterium]|nr:bdbD [Verrucomicrobiales bacterium]